MRAGVARPAMASTATSKVVTGLMRVGPSLLTPGGCGMLTSPRSREDATIVVPRPPSGRPLPVWLDSSDRRYAVNGPVEGCNGVNS